MKKMGLVLFAVMLAAVMSWSTAFGADCYILTGGDYFDGDMTLTLTTEASGETSDTLSVKGSGVDSKGNTSLFSGSTTQPGHTMEYSLNGSGHVNDDKSITAFYDYHITLGPSGSGYTGIFSGEIHTNTGSEKNVNGQAASIACP